MNFRSLSISVAIYCFIRRENVHHEFMYVCDKTWHRRWKSWTRDSNGFASSHGTLLLCGLRWIAFPAQRHRTVPPPAMPIRMPVSQMHAVYARSGAEDRKLPLSTSRQYASCREVAVAVFGAIVWATFATDHTAIRGPVVAVVDVLTPRIAGISSAWYGSRVPVHAEAGLLFVCVACQTISSPYRRQNQREMVLNR